jgi:hypothetical protein
MGMLELGGDVDLAEEPIGAERSGELGLEDLHRHLAAMLRVLGDVDGGHPAVPDFTFDGVAPRQRTLQAEQGIGHGEQLLRNEPAFKMDAGTSRR